MNGKQHLTTKQPVYIQTVMKSVYDALNIEPNQMDYDKIRMKYWQFFSSPWASSVEYEERHLELAR